MLLLHTRERERGEGKGGKGEGRKRRGSEGRGEERGSNQLMENLTKTKIVIHS